MRMLDPVLAKRWRRFHARKRARFALWGLLGLLLLGLSAELICNDRPLYMRYEGRSFFPAFRFYPESAFVPNGRNTRADYKALNETARFRDPPGNVMVFAPIPYGPYEILDPADLRAEERVRVTLTPRPVVGSVDVDPEGVIVRHRAADPFFKDTDRPIRGQTLTNAWRLSPELKAALLARFANRPAPAFAQTCPRIDDPDRQTELSLSTFRPRSRPPRTVRLTLRADTDANASFSGYFNRKGRLMEGAAGSWSGRALVTAAVARAFAQAVIEEEVEQDGRPYRLRAERQDVRWPHPPTRAHPLGVDAAGRDVLARMIYGLRTALLFGLMLASAALIVGTAVGGIQGYFGGWVDLTLQRGIEIWSALPFLYVMILLGSIYGRSFGLLLGCYAVFNWIGLSYYMRAEFLRLRHQPFVEAARCLGIAHGRIMRRHILPNALTPLITFFPFSLVGAIGALTALDFLGFGLPPPTPSWGELLYQAQAYRWAWWLIAYPSLALFVVMLLGVLLGEGVRDAFDPKPHVRWEA